MALSTLAKVATMGRDLNDVVVFTKVVEARSFTAAAKLLGLPTSTVSRRVSRLEAELGVRLLQRTTRKLSLTEAGQLYYERGVRALAELEDAENLLAESRSEPRGRVKVLAPVEQTITVQVINEFLVAHPQVRVDLECTSREPNIIQEGYDVAIHVGAVTNLSVVAHKLVDSEFVMVASADYLKRTPAPATAAALADHDCLILGDSSAKATWTLFGVGGSELRVPVRGRLAVNHLQALRAAVLAGLGIAALPTVVCREDVEAGRLKPVLPGIAPAPIPIYVTYPSGKFLAPAVRVFVDFMRGRFAEVAGITSA